MLTLINLVKRRFLFLFVRQKYQWSKSRPLATQRRFRGSDAGNFNYSGETNFAFLRYANLVSFSLSFFLRRWSNTCNRCRIGKRGNTAGWRVISISSLCIKLSHLQDIKMQLARNVSRMNRFPRFYNEMLEWNNISDINREWVYLKKCQFQIAIFVMFIIYFNLTILTI